MCRINNYCVLSNKHLPSFLLNSELVVSVPIAAPSFSVMPNGATSLRVEWDKLPPDKARGVITGYRVLYRQHDKTSKRMGEVLADRNFYIITGKY